MGKSELAIATGVTRIRRRGELMSRSELVGIAAIGAAGAVLQERLRSQPLLAAGVAGGAVLMNAYVATAPDAVIVVALLLLVAGVALM